MFYISKSKDESQRILCAMALLKTSACNVSNQEAYINFDFQADDYL